MSNARRFLIAAATLLVAVAASAQHDGHTLSPDELRALAASLSDHGPVVLQPESVAIAPNAVKAIAITARQFDFSPSTFTVNQGDVVQLTVSVPSNDGSAV